MREYEDIVRLQLIKSGKPNEAGDISPRVVNHMISYTAVLSRIRYTPHYRPIARSLISVWKAPRL